MPPTPLQNMKLAAIAVTATISSIMMTALPSKAYDYLSGYRSGSSLNYSGYLDGDSYSGSINRIGKTINLNEYSGGDSYHGSCTSIGSYVSCYGY